MKRFTHLLSGALLGLALASCGGGGNTVAEGGIGGTGISSGSISAFGSIVVNGTKFDVSAAPITVNGDPNATEDDLDIGYVVRVDGDLDDGVAETVRFEANLIGEVDTAPQPDGTNQWTLTVMQQTVRVTGTTVLKGVADIQGVAQSDNVLVSGFPVLDESASDDLVATHLEALSAPPSIDQIVGRIDSTTPGTGFKIGNLDVIASESVDVGDLVIVRGQYEAGVPDFDADSVEEVEDLAAAGTEIELEGIVDSVDNQDSFTVSGIRVDASGASVTNGPVTQGAEVEVEGSFDTTGTILLADQIEVELEDNVEIVARVSSVQLPNGPISVLNNGVNDVSVNVTDKTRLRDKSDTPVENFSVADLSAGDWIELDGFEDSSGTVTALQVERFTPDPVKEEVTVEGIIDVEPSADTLTILGIDFRTDPDTTTFEGVSDLNGIGKDDVVEVEWTDATPEDPDPSIDLPQPVEKVELEEDN